MRDSVSMGILRKITFAKVLKLCASNFSVRLAHQNNNSTAWRINDTNTIRCI